jgi:hypothetical protein
LGADDLYQWPEFCPSSGAARTPAMPLLSERRDAPRVDAMTGALGQALEARRSR